MLNSKSYRNIAKSVEVDIKKVEDELSLSVCGSSPVYSGLEHFLLSPSKRIRTVLTSLYLKMNGFDITPKHISLMAVVEIIHNASLIHDDVIDNDLIRRSEKNINAIFGNKMAVISGDYLLSIVMGKLCQIKVPELFNIFAGTIKNMCEGEIFQYTNLYKIPAIDEYIEKSYQKTGVLFAAGLTAAVYLSTGQKNKQADDFGSKFGIAFQIRDDINNVLNGAKDVKEGIYNAPVIYSGDKNNPLKGIEKTKVLLNNYTGGLLKDIFAFEDNVYKAKIAELLDLLNG